MSKFKFIDLFSGIGGFHQAMEYFGGECVLASDIDANAINVYKNNYNIDSNINIRDIKTEDIPDFDVLCAGFPCQSFSIAGKKKGFLDETRGTLFFEIARILEVKHPKYILLENVKNLVSHDNGNTYRVIRETLNKLGYRLTEEPLILSPHQFGVPQSRERIYIPGVYDPNNVNTPIEIKFDNLLKKKDNSIYSILDENENSNEYQLSEHMIKVLECWEEFIQGVKNKPTFPINLTYFNNIIEEDLPDWKEKVKNKNINFYNDNKVFIDNWMKKWNNLEEFTPTERKLEWCCGNTINSIYEGAIQKRQSGVRVKTPDVFPTLVAMVQTPIIGKYKRYLSVREAARLQSFPDTFIPDSNTHQAYKQFGNSVNIKVLIEIFKQLQNY